MCLTRTHSFRQALILSPKLALREPYFGISVLELHVIAENCAEIAELRRDGRFSIITSLLAQRATHCDASWLVHFYVSRTPSAICSMFNVDGKWRVEHARPPPSPSPAASDVGRKSPVRPSGIADSLHIDHRRRRTAGSAHRLAPPPTLVCIE